MSDAPLLNRVVRAAQRLGRTHRKALLPAWLWLHRQAAWHHLLAAVAADGGPRRRVFGVGLPKTGTHSLAALFDCRAAHEPETHILYDVARALDEGEATSAAVATLRARDRWLGLDLESNWMLGLVLDPLIEAFPEAHFVLTYREPLEWLESQINEHLINHHQEPYQAAMRRMYGWAPYAPEDAPLRDRGLYAVDGYLGHWAAYYEEALDRLPEGRRVVVRTDALSADAERIGAALGGLTPARGAVHAYARPEKPFVLPDHLDMDRVHARAEALCRPTWARLQAASL